MDVSQVYQLFSASFHHEPNVRLQAELELKKIEQSDGFLVALLQILASDQTYLAVRQAVAVYFKNRIARSWTDDSSRKSKPNYVAIPPQDRLAVKQNILHLLTISPPIVRVQLTSALGTILHDNFPEQWPDFMDNIHRLLQLNEAASTYAGLLALLEAIKIYKWRSRDDRKSLDTIIKAIFPILLDFGTNFVQQDNTEAAEMLRCILKAYKNASYLHLPVALQESSSIIPWGTLFLTVIQKPIPLNIQPSSPEQRENHPWWRTKKWAYHNLNRLFSRYGSPSQLSGSMKVYTKFAQIFEDKFAPEILNVYLRQTEGWIQKKEWLSDRALHYIISYFNDCINPKSTWKLLKAHTETIIAHVIYPLICFSDKDAELWEADPIEYITANIDFLDEVVTASSIAIVFLKNLARSRKKHSFMKILSFVNSALEHCAKTADKSERIAREKHGAFKMISHLSDLILAPKSQVSDMMEPFLVNQVYPEFASPFGFLREVACNLVQEFAVLKFKNTNNLAIAFHSIMKCLSDQELPVKTQAALALQPMFSHDEVRAAMTPNVGTIMQTLLNLQNELDLDTLAGVTAEFVEVFADELTPFAVQTTTQLRDTYFRLMQEVVETRGNYDPNDPTADGNFMDRGDDKIFAGMGLLKTMSTLIMTLDGSVETFQQLETVILPLVKFTVEHNLVDVFDEMFEIVEGLTFITRNISPTLWKYFPLLYQAYFLMPDSFDALSPVLDNFISFGKDRLITDADVQRMLSQIIHHAMTTDDTNELGRVAACKVMESILLNCRGQVDGMLVIFLPLVMPYVLDQSTIHLTYFRVQAIEVPVNAIYYNPIATLRIFEDNGWTARVFEVWFSNLKKFSRVHDKKLAILAMCSLIKLPLEHIPSSLHTAWSRILSMIVALLKSLPAAQQYRTELEEAMMGDEDSEDVLNGDIDDGELEEEEEEDGDEDVDDIDVQDKEDHAYFEMLAREAADMENGKNANGIVGDNNDDDEELDEELDYQSPLEVINVYNEFHKTLLLVQQEQPGSYQILTKDLSNDQQSYILSIAQRVELEQLK